MKKSIIPWIRKKMRYQVKALLALLGMTLLTACAATVPAGTSAANVALANERAAIASSCNTAGLLGPVLKSGQLSGFFTPAVWLKIQDIYVTLHPICHPVGGIPPSLTNYASISLTLAQSVANLTQYATETHQLAQPKGVK